MNTTKYLNKYLLFIKSFETELRKEYNIPIHENTWNYMVNHSNRKGKIGEYEYMLHGAGFTVKKNDIICEYDRAPLNHYNIKFSFWKFKNFIETSYSQIIIDDAQLKSDLLEMIFTNTLSWLIIDDINWNIYQANLTKD
ncbi:DUF6896 domain-containing protein [Chryseobacterium fistulae]|nr:hypothetical protein [Chryseobacterium fistulae]